MNRFSRSWDSNNLIELSDLQLVTEVKKWNKIAFEVIYDRYHYKLYNYIWNTLNYNADDANNITADVFIKLYEYIKTKDVTNLKSFLYQMAHNACVDLIRSNKSMQTHSDETTMELLSDDSNEENKDKLNSEYKQVLITDLLKQLEAKYRDVLYLYYNESKSYEDIAQLIWSNKNSVWTLVFQAKAKLKELAQRYGVTDALSD